MLATVAVGLGAMVGVGDAAVGDGVGEGAGVALGVGEATGLGVGDGFGVGVGEDFAAIMIEGAPRRRQAANPSTRGTIWRLFFDEVFTII